MRDICAVLSFFRKSTSTSLSKGECVAQLLFVCSIGSSWMISLKREERKKDSEQQSFVLNTSLRSPLSKRIELARRSDRICSFSSKWPSDDVQASICPILSCSYGRHKRFLSWYCFLFQTSALKLTRAKELLAFNVWLKRWSSVSSCCVQRNVMDARFVWLIGSFFGVFDRKMQINFWNSFRKIGPVNVYT